MRHNGHEEASNRDIADMKGLEGGLTKNKEAKLAIRLSPWKQSDLLRIVRRGRRASLSSWCNKHVLISNKTEITEFKGTNLMWDSISSQFSLALQNNSRRATSLLSQWNDGQGLEMCR